MRCGLLEADEVIFISDGGGWCDTVARAHFHDAVRILDWYHLVEHVWAAAGRPHPLFRLTPEEALLGTTAHAARALGLADRGRIAPGLRADLCLWEADHPAELSYRIGATHLHARIFGGRLDD